MQKCAILVITAWNEPCSSNSHASSVSVLSAGSKYALITSWTSSFALCVRNRLFGLSVMVVPYVAGSITQKPALHVKLWHSRTHGAHEFNQHMV